MEDRETIFCFFDAYVMGPTLIMALVSTSMEDKEIVFFFFDADVMGPPIDLNT
jgi:hypothetical protein